MNELNHSIRVTTADAAPDASVRIVEQYKIEDACPTTSVKKS